MCDYKTEVCGHCEYFIGEECDGSENEGSETYDDYPACWQFKIKDIILI